MSSEEFKALARKISDGTATFQERVSFLRELNIALESLQEILREKRTV